MGVGSFNVLAVVCDALFSTFFVSLEHVPWYGGYCEQYSAIFAERAGSGWWDVNELET